MEGTGQPVCASGVEMGRELGLHAATRNLPTFTAIVTAHDEAPWSILTNLGHQSIKPNQVLTAVSNWQPLPETVWHYVETIEYHKNKEDYGYDKRNKLLAKATQDYVGFFCHDDKYELDYIESMLTAAVEGNADVVYCGWDEPNKAAAGGFRVLDNCQFQPFDSTLGNFIVRTSLMKQIGGFPINASQSLIQIASVFKTVAGMPSEADAGKGWLDALAIDMLKLMTTKIVKVNRVLFHHNQPYWEEMRPSMWGSKT